VHLNRPRCHARNVSGPPAEAEELYSPEVFGRSGSDLVVVKERRLLP
jgi:hypothetical protein